MTRRNAAFALLGLTSCGGGSQGGTTLRNVSYDPTREFYQDFNQAFAAFWSKSGKGAVSVEQSHGGSAKQARSVMDGLEADVVTLALAYDIDAISSRTSFLPPNWQTRLPNNSCPYTSTIVMVTRKGNPKGVRDWSDLVKPGLQVITPNPKTSGGARWNYLAAWGYAKRAFGADKKVEDFIGALYRNVPVLDSGARGATTSFVQRKLGDVLLCWENEAWLARKEFASEELEIVAPPQSILAEPPVALLDVMADRRGTRPAAQAYLEYLYSSEGQAIAAKHYFRPYAKAVKHNLPELEMFTLRDIAANWSEANERHFRDGGLFDRIYQPGA